MMLHYTQTCESCVPCTCVRKMYISIIVYSYIYVRYSKKSYFYVIILEGLEQQFKGGGSK